MPGKSYDAQEMELNLADMLWAIIMKWRTVFICAVLFAVLAGGLSYIRSGKQIEAAKQAADQEIQLEGEALDNAMDYLAYWELYRKQKEYNENSLMMQLDANGFYKTVLAYYVDNLFAVEYPQVEKKDNISAFINQYISCFESDEFYEKLPDIENSGNKKAYYSEAIDLNNLYGAGRATRADDNLLIIAIYSSSEENGLAIAEIIDATIKEKKAQITGLLGEHEVTMVRNECIFTADTNLLSYQHQNYVAQNTQRVNMSALKKDLTKEELAYINQEMKEERESSAEAAGESGQAEAELQNASPSISKKLVAVGFIAGAILAVGIFAFGYLFRARLGMRDDFERLYGIKLLGNVIYEDKRKKLFGFIDRLLIKLRDHRKHYFKEEEACGMIAAGVRIAAVKAGVDTIFVTGTNLEGKGKDFIEKLSGLLKKDNITILSGNSILYDASALEQMADTGYVVFVEEAGKSLYDEIKSEIETCHYHKVEMIGAVVVGVN